RNRPPWKNQSLLHLLPRLPPWQSRSLWLSQSSPLPHRLPLLHRLPLPLLYRLPLLWHSRSLLLLSILKQHLPPRSP
ncbi:MAG: hypothetical protein LBS63_03900, partial [Prevotellaceae bacterium]|nr:hypothetical protein [Prevotellaceae bacterium]